MFKRFNVDPECLLVWSSIILFLLLFWGCVVTLVLNGG